MVSQVVDVSGSKELGSPAEGGFPLPSLKGLHFCNLSSGFFSCVSDQVTLGSIELGFHVAWVMVSWAWWHSLVILAMCGTTASSYLLQYELSESVPK